MKTIIFKVEYSNKESIDYDSRVYSSIVRWALERYFENKDYKTVYNDAIKKFKINSYLLNCAVREAKGIYKTELEKIKEAKKENRVYHKPCFGQIKRLVKGYITKEEYKKQRNRGFFSEGQVDYNGNRLFQIDLQNQIIIYKRSRHEHISLKILENLKGKRKLLFGKIYLAMQNKSAPISFRIRDDKLYISYDETLIEKEKQFKNLKQNRILGLDLNPNYIGVSVLEFDDNDKFKIIHKKVFDITELNEYGNKNKTKYELQQINNQIIQLCNHFKCSKLSIEDLKFKKSDKFFSKAKNKLCKNTFRYSQIKNHLQILCNVYGVEFVEVNAAYSSFVGNCIYGNETTPDMIAASIEIARRGYKKYLKDWFYPSIISMDRYREVLGNQWKKELKLHLRSWKTMFKQIKESKLRYRFPLVDKVAVLSKNYYKKKINLYCFN